MRSKKSIKRELKQVKQELRAVEARLVELRAIKAKAQAKRDEALNGVAKAVSGMKRDEFYELAMKPEWPDTMAFQLERPGDTEDDERTFSEEGIDGIARQVRDFMLARTYAQYVKTGKGPKRVRIEVNLKWDILPEGDDHQDLPWFHLHDENHEFLRVNGLNRLPLDNGRKL